MNMTRMNAVILRQSFLMKGSLSRVLPMFVWVGIDIVLWGFITRYLGTLVPSGFNVVTVFLGAILLWDLFSRVMHALDMAFLEDVWSRNFLNIFATPMTTGEYLCGLVMVAVLTSLVSLAFMLGIGTLAFGLTYAGGGLAIAGFVAILFLFGIALGITGVAIVLRWGPASEWFIWPLPALLSPFAGVFYPIATLPGWMQVIAHAMPPSYVFEGLRALANGDALPKHAMLWGFLLAFAYIAAACLLFRRVFNMALRTGLIARYSAESVN